MYCNIIKDLKYFLVTATIILLISTGCHAQYQSSCQPFGCSVDSFWYDQDQTLGSINITTNKNAVVTFSSSDFTNNFYGFNGAALVDIIILSLPTNGTLQLSGTTLNIGQSIPVGQLNNLIYTPNIGFIGVDSFKWNGCSGSLYAYTAANANIIIKDSSSLTSSSFLSLFSSSPTESSLPMAITSSASSVIVEPSISSSSISSGSIPTEHASSSKSDSSIAITSNSASSLLSVEPNSSSALASSNSQTSSSPKSSSAAAISSSAGSDIVGSSTSSSLISSSIPTLSSSSIQHDQFPTLTNAIKSGYENTVMTFAIADFTNNFSDFSDGLTHIKILSLPEHGILTLSKMEVIIDQIIQLSDLENLIFTPTNNWVGSTSFKWNASNKTLYAANDANFTITILPGSPTRKNSINQWIIPSIAAPAAVAVAGIVTASIISYKRNLLCFKNREKTLTPADVSIEVIEMDDIYPPPPYEQYSN